MDEYAGEARMNIREQDAKPMAFSIKLEDSNDSDDDGSKGMSGRYKKKAAADALIPGFSCLDGFSEEVKQEENSVGFSLTAAITKPNEAAQKNNVN